MTATLPQRHAPVDDRAPAPVHVLMLEDNRLDAQLTAAQLSSSGISVKITRACTRDEFCAALDDHTLDLILADFVLPQFDGITALEIARQTRPELPFIIVSGTLGEELAIETLKRGATDYVLKQRITRLGMAVKRALREADDRRKRLAAEEEMQRARESAERANKAKDQFLAMLSHELRTPLNPVMAAVGVLENSAGLTQETGYLIELIRRNVELQARLIDDLLDLTRIAKGKFELQIEPVDSHAVIERVLEICRTDLGAKNLRIATDLTARRHVVMADAARLHQVLWNLIKNAVKFTPPFGGIAIRTADAENESLALEVVDTGVGIAPANLESIFNPFNQGDDTQYQRMAGLGLGLTIARAIVEAHGGSIIAASDGLNQGSRFTVIMPQAQLPMAPSRPRVAKAERNCTKAAFNSGGLDILLVEDHPDTQQVMIRVLNQFGHRVVTAGSVAEALAITESRTFNLLISDIGLPDGTGVDLMRELNARNRTMPAIALSGYGMDQDVKNSMSVGFAMHLTKPVNIDKLFAAIGKTVVERA